MAARAKPAKAAASKGNGRGGTKRAPGANGITLDDVREYFDKVHEISDEMEEASAGARGEIGRVYEKACEKLDVSKDALVFMFKEERRQRKAAAKAAKMDTRARDSLQKLSQAFGDSPMGTWASEMAQRAGTEAAG